MGNCCTSTHKKNNLTKTASPQKKSSPHHKYLKFKSISQNFSYKLEYHPQKTLQNYLNHIRISHLQDTLDLLQVTNKNHLITDFNQSLLSLEIFPTDTLYIEFSPRQPKIDSKISGEKGKNFQKNRKKIEKKHRKTKNSITESDSMSNEQVAEEESTTKFQPNVFQAKFNANKVKSEMNKGVSLWKTALSPQKIIPKEYSKEGDSSSVLNPLDLTIENKLETKFIKYEVKNGQSVLCDSDDSYIKSDGKVKGDVTRHPCDFFKDLQGPFSALHEF